MSRLLFNWKGNGYHLQLYLTCLPDPLAGNVHKLTSALKAKIVLTVRYILAPAPQLQLEKNNKLFIAASFEIHMPAWAFSWHCLG